MDDEIDRLVLTVRADTAAFARDVGEMRRQLDGPLAGGVSNAGDVMADALSRAARSGSDGFDALQRTATGVLADIAAQALQLGLGPGSSLGSLVAGLTGGSGAPGRATGGAVVEGRPYWVGERGPELFVPGSSGRIEPSGTGRGPVSITVNLNTPADAQPAFMARSARQVARAVAQALEDASR